MGGDSWRGWCYFSPIREQLAGRRAAWQCSYEATLDSSNYFRRQRPCADHTGSPLRVVEWEGVVFNEARSVASLQRAVQRIAQRQGGIHKIEGPRQGTPGKS